MKDKHCTYHSTYISTWLGFKNTPYCINCYIIHFVIIFVYILTFVFCIDRLMNQKVIIEFQNFNLHILVNLKSVKISFRNSVNYFDCPNCLCVGGGVNYLLRDFNNFLVFSPLFTTSKNAFSFSAKRKIMF